jgi:NAD(P)-dependent dehydrogenase (short-subunit alcohol dehydrogenase family)
MMEQYTVRISSFLLLSLLLLLFIRNPSQVESRVVDVSDCDAMMKLAEEVYANGGNCHFLMNNAGVGHPQWPSIPMAQCMDVSPLCPK